MANIKHTLCLVIIFLEGKMCLKPLIFFFHSFVILDCKNPLDYIYKSGASFKICFNLNLPFVTLLIVYFEAQKT